MEENITLKNGEKNIIKGNIFNQSIEFNSNSIEVLKIVAEALHDIVSVFKTQSICLINIENETKSLEE